MSLDWKVPTWTMDPDGDIDEYEEPNESLIDSIKVPGTLLRMKDGTLNLIGHVSKNLGRCDCCRGIQWQNVDAYAVVWVQS